MVRPSAIAFGVMSRMLFACAAARGSLWSLFVFIMVKVRVVDRLLLLVLFLLFLLCDVVLAFLPPWSSQGGFRLVRCFVCMVHVAFFAGCLGLASSHFCLMLLGACTSACLFALSNICVCWCFFLFAAPMLRCVRVSVVCVKQHPRDCKTIGS